MAGEPRYRFGPLERRGLIAGWRGGQIAAVAVGALLALVMLRRPSVPAVSVAVACVAASVAVACWPIGGRTTEEWLPTLVRWGAGPGGRRRRCPLPARGRRVRGDRPSAPTRAPRRRDGPFAAVEILALEPGPPGAAGPHSDGGPVGVLFDRVARTYSAVLAVRGHSFALLGPDDKQRRVSSWSAVLASLAREHTLVHRLQWLAAAVPDDGRAVRGHLARRLCLPDDAPATSSYRALLDGAGADTCHHEVHLVVQIRAGGPLTRRHGRSGRRPATASVLVRELATLRRLLADADVHVEEVLGPRALAGLCRSGAEAHPRAGPERRSGPGWPWPMATEARWDRLRTDATWQATYWVAEWPRVEVGPDFLGPLLLGSVRRRLSVVMQPMSPSRATRQVEQARTADIADAELRRRGGFLATARRARETELVERREAELADGHGSFRFSGYVTVTATSDAELDEACAATEQAAGQARLELRRLFGDQESAYACTLPLGRGLS